MDLFYVGSVPNAGGKTLPKMFSDIMMLLFLMKKLFLNSYPRTLRRDLLETPVSTFNLTEYAAPMTSVQKLT